ncbi:MULTISPECIES: hypothetical protein [Serratia]|uniref:hypothetical protein n=1 Tax=Serratia TaxID=613 RepID=UPI00313C5209
MRLLQFFRRKPQKTPVKHNYTKMFWGHAIQGLSDNFNTKRKFNVTGHGPINLPFGPAISDGDFILISSNQGPVIRLKVIKAEYFRDPSDMFSATLKFDGVENQEVFHG